MGIWTVHSKASADIPEQVFHGQIFFLRFGWTPEWYHGAKWQVHLYLVRSCQTSAKWWAFPLSSGESFSCSPIPYTLGWVFNFIKMLSHRDISLHSLKSYFWASFCVFISHLYIIFGGTSLCHLIIFIWLSTFYWLAGVTYILCLQVLSQIYVLWIFSASLWLPLCFLNDMFQGYFKILMLFDFPICSL